MISSNFLTVLCNVFFFLFLSGAYSTTFTVTNKCKYTVWPAISSEPGSSPLSNTGFTLLPGDSNTLPVPPAWSGRLWGRTLCSLDTTGKFSCVTGDCGTSTVECAGGNPTSPVTLVEFHFNDTSGLILYDISLVDGFNLPVEVAPRSRNCSATACLTDLNMECPMELKVTKDGKAVACKSTCQTQPCSSSLFFKTACSGARVNAQYDHSFFTCSSSHYTVTFCSTPKSGMMKKHSGKKVGIYGGSGGVLSVIGLICLFIKFRIRIHFSKNKRLGNQSWGRNQRDYGNSSQRISVRC